ncbi:ATP-binding cassette subfamily B protein [Paenibacillus endophyticus]|uniref:ATP-binding cassette subfamily B protein n=1 Tax=Paenibacillus endophyticus TaxID=1294268 RepID=A0A7W5C4P1_9BACL|nr:ABC transporter ATP-binding protein [Paenibacillus endophyticus]MBB3150988.1 ATP-binding cassette subfamily B protein [Paenibacillus endophyticus]
MKPKRILADFFRKTWPIYLISTLFHLLSNLINVFYPKVLGQFTDKLQMNGLTSSLIVDYSLLLLVIGIGHVLFNGIAMYLIMYVGRKFEFLVRRGLFKHFTEMGERFYSKNGVGKLLSYFMNDVTAVRESISMGFNATANATMLLIAAVTMMLLSHIPYYLILASVFPLLLIPIIVVYLGPVIRRRSLEVQEALGKMTETAEEQFGGIRVTKKFAVETIMNERFGKTVDQIRHHQLRLVRVSSFFQALIPFLGAIALVVALAFGGYLTITKQITLGNFVALTLYIRMLMNPLQQIGNVINTIQRSRASLERLNGLLSQQADIVELENAKEMDLADASISIQGLTFAYEQGSNPVLKDINLSVKAGAMLGIIGRTGSGKTTLMKLLLRTIDPPQGAIRYGNTDVRELTLASLRSQLAYVPQDGFLFSTTIRENIAFSNRELPLDTVEAAAKHAQIYDNIAELPNQFETRLGERGLTLSGGQRQRTSLARGIIKDAPIMILDDSVSAVDAVTEKDIIDALQKQRKDKTTIIIAHRISAIKHADEIVVLDDGVIVQRGTHAQLLTQQGLYATLHAIQEEGSQHATGTSHS